MTTFPDKLRNRAAGMIAASADLVTAAHVRISAIGSQVSSLTPGDWEDITLSGGWSNVAGYIPAQVRILQSGMSQLVGHIQGGTVTDGTLIGTLAGGFFNPSHAHKFTGNAVLGAASVAHPGTGDVTDSLILAAPIPTTFIPTSDHTVNVTGSGMGHVILGPSGTTFQNIPGASYTGTTTMHNTALTSSTNVNKNSPFIDLSVTGQLTIMNFDPSVTEISFSELIPLVTA